MARDPQYVNVYADADGKQHLAEKSQRKRSVAKNNAYLVRNLLGFRRIGVWRITMKDTPHDPNATGDDV